MPNSLSLLATQLKEIWRHFGVNQKFSVIVGLIIIAASIGGVLYWSSRPDFQLLYSGLSLKDASSVREQLSDEKIPYQLKDSGRTILVPAQDVYRGRLLLAAQGLPKDNSTGFELFEQPKFGLTDFAQQVNYQRALQGELERTIMTMSGIEAARVMLVLPKERLFSTEDEKKASASILLTLSGGASLAPGQVQSIAQLVGSSVPGLDPAAITITDQRGQLLSQRSGASDDQSQQAGDQLAMQSKLEALLAQKAQDMLDKAMGPGRSIVRVNAVLDFSKIERRSEQYDAEGRVVRSEAIESESSSSPAGNGGGVAGVVANVPVGSPSSGTVEQEMSRSKKENVRTEYAIPSEVEMVTRNGAQLANLSVSVCVAKGEEPRTEAELKKIEQMVKSSVGFTDSETRKDLIDVSEMVFAPPALPPSIPWYQTLPIRWDSLGRGIVAALLVFIVYRLSRRVIAGLVVRREDAGVPVQSLTDEYGRPGARGFKGEPGSLDANLDEITQIAEQNPKAIAAWISSIAKPS
ncbi:MAG TPA: flagellar M-ring protein FliF [Verrucomicrobia bacterium]|nr:MAG: flagellar M-ring protein FliF [Lentisphaerae bacterium GWF2_57_35]HBA84870.1 flagellar M-ring protein FliF [Verrucomicrobiota bacterium]